MDVTPLIKKGQQIIQSYAHGAFKVTGVVYPGAIIITSSATVAWDVADPVPEALKSSDFEQFTAYTGQIDILIIGTGARPVFLPPDLVRPVKLLKINMETMDTGAACRTYNVLMTEGRRVAAALLPVLAA